MSLEASSILYMSLVNTGNTSRVEVASSLYVTNNTLPLILYFNV